MEYSYSSAAWAALAQVPRWYLLAIALAGWYYGFPYLRQRYADWKVRRGTQGCAGKSDVDPSLLRERLSALEASRQRMQSQYRIASIAAREQEKIDLEKKRQRRVTSAEHNDKEDCTNVPLKGRSKGSLKDEYNPLMGDSSRGYRPPKRSCCGKGGCG
ncbi:hypothetical protein KM043_000169 [Ampulex compressa]|nr:hypothetical protein KM043_000169 [Ampulex compressa]